MRRYYRDLNGGILEAFGIMFSRDLKVYALSVARISQPSDVLMRTVENAPLAPAHASRCYDYLRFNKRIIGHPPTTKPVPARHLQQAEALED